MFTVPRTSALEFRFRSTVVEQAEIEVHWSWSAILTDPVRLELLHVLCQMGAATTAELRRHCHTSDPTVRRHLEALEALGVVREYPGVRDGLTPGRPARRYLLDLEAASKLSVLFELLNEPLVTNPPPEPRPRQARDMEPAPCKPPREAARASAPSFLR